MEALAKRIHTDYKGQELDVFVIMNSAFKFFTDLLVHLNKIMEHTGELIKIRPSFFKITSYHLNQQVVDKDKVIIFQC